MSLAAYQASPDVNSFTSRRDIALRKELACKQPNGEFALYYNANWCTRLARKKDLEDYGKFPLFALSHQENYGHDLFYGVQSELNEAGTIAGCDVCHADRPADRAFVGLALINRFDDGTEPLQLYTDQAYHTIGIPFNREIPGAVPGEVQGVSTHLTVGFNGSPTAPGFFKDPTLRNLGKGEEKGKAYGHNGYFKTLEQIVHFYSTRDLKPDCAAVIPGIEHPTVEEAMANECWPAPEFSKNPFGGVGNLNLTAEEEAALVAYLRALSDRYTPRAPIRVR